MFGVMTKQKDLMRRYLPCWIINTTADRFFPFTNEEPDPCFYSNKKKKYAGSSGCFPSLAGPFGRCRPFPATGA
eukprot:18703_5